MAGGKGTRLRPLTSNWPKPMIPVANLPCMEHILNLLKRHDLTDVLATLEYMPDLIRDYFGDGSGWGVTLEYSVEEEPRGTAGSVKFVEDRLPGRFVVVSGDALTDVDLGAAIAFHEERGAEVTLVLKEVTTRRSSGSWLPGRTVASSGLWRNRTRMKPSRPRPTPASTSSSPRCWGAYRRARSTTGRRTSSRRWWRRGARCTGT